MSHQKETPPGGGVRLKTITDPDSGLTATVPDRINTGELALRGMVIVAFDHALFALGEAAALRLSDEIRKSVQIIRQRQSRSN